MKIFNQMEDPLLAEHNNIGYGFRAHAQQQQQR